MQFNGRNSISNALMWNFKMLCVFVEYYVRVKVRKYVKAEHEYEHLINSLFDILFFFFWKKESLFRNGFYRTSTHLINGISNMK